MRVKTELAKRDMSISELSRKLQMHQGMLSDIINGIRRSKKTEAKIAAFFGKEPMELFPSRTREELDAMSKTEAA